MSDRYVINKETLDAIGEAVRSKTKGSELIPVADLASSIRSIQGGPAECFLYGSFMCKSISYSTNVTEGISHTVTGSVSAKVVDSSGSFAADMSSVARISLRALAGDSSGNYAIVYDASSSSISYDYSSIQGYPFYVTFNERETVSADFFMAFVAMFEPMEIIPAGSHEMFNCACEEYTSGAFAWSDQALNGKLTCDYNSKTDQAFTTVSNDGEHSVYFYNDGSTVAGFTPSWDSTYTTKITFDEAQFVSEAFKTWWDMCFKAVEKEDSGSEILQAGTYTLNNTWYNVDYFVIEGWTEQALSGTVKDGISGDTITFNSMSYYESGTDSSSYYGNELYFRNDGSSVLSLNYNYDSASYTHTITLTETQIVSSGFKAWWDECTTKVEDSSGDSSTTYTLSGSWEQSVECYDYFTVHGNISGTVTVSGTENSFKSIKYDGMGEPYITFYELAYYSDGGVNAYYTAYTRHPIYVNFGETETEVDKSFYNWFTTNFTKL